MFRGVTQRDLARVWQLIDGFAEADRERLDRNPRLLLHQGDDGAGIESAAQKRANWDVSDHLSGNGLPQKATQLLGRLFDGYGRRPQTRRPVRPDRRFAVLPDEIVTRRERLDLFVDGAIGRQISKGQITID